MTAPAETLTWPALSAAVALVTRAGNCPEASRADLLGGLPPGEVLAVLEILTAGILAAVFPQDGGASVLQKLALCAATGCSRDAHGGPQ